MNTLSAKQKKLSYFREVQNEMKKVSWTSREELTVSTKAVLYAIFLFGFSIYLVDLVIRGGLDAIAKLFQLGIG